MSYETPSQPAFAFTLAQLGDLYAALRVWAVEGPRITTRVLSGGFTLGARIPRCRICYHQQFQSYEAAWAMVCEYLGAQVDCWKLTELPEVEGWEGVG